MFDPVSRRSVVRMGAALAAMTTGAAAERVAAAQTFTAEIEAAIATFPENDIRTNPVAFAERMEEAAFDYDDDLEALGNHVAPELWTAYIRAEDALRAVLQDLGVYEAARPALNALADTATYLLFGGVELGVRRGAAYAALWQERVGRSSLCPTCHGHDTHDEPCTTCAGIGTVPVFA